MGMASSSFQISNESCEGMIDDIRSEWRKDAIRSYVRLFWVGRSIESSSSQANEVKEQRRDRERSKRKGLRDEGVKGLRKNLLTQRTQRSERIKYFWFMGEIVTGGVGQWRTYGPRGR